MQLRVQQKATELFPFGWGDAAVKKLVLLISLCQQSQPIKQFCVVFLVSRMKALFVKNGVSRAENVACQWRLITENLIICADFNFLCFSFFKAFPYNFCW